MDRDAVTLMIDSGVGGLSVQTLAHLRMPNENFCFFADAANAPYGEKSPEEIRYLLHKIINKYKDRNIKAILLACNTATSAAAAELREELSIPVIGVEPALKPAVLNTKGQVIVLATRLTIREKKFRNLLAQYEYDRDIVPLACSGLMELVEKDPASPETKEYLLKTLIPYKETAEALVLGCTHYIFLRPVLRELFPQMRLFDGNDGVTRHLENVLLENAISGGRGTVEVDCSLIDPAQKAAYLEKCEKMMLYCREIYTEQVFAD